MSDPIIRLPFSYLPLLISSLLSNKNDEESLIDGIQHVSYLLTHLSSSEMATLANDPLIFKTFACLVKRQDELKKTPAFTGAFLEHDNKNYSSIPLFFILQHCTGQSLDPQSINDSLWHLINNKEYEVFAHVLLNSNLKLDEALKIDTPTRTNLIDLISRTQNIHLLELVVEHMESPSSWRFDQCDSKRGYFGYDLPQYLYKKSLNYSAHANSERSLFYKKALDLLELHGCKIEGALVSSMYRDLSGVLDYDLLISLKDRLPEELFEQEHYNAILKNLSLEHFQTLFLEKIKQNSNSTNGFWFKHLLKTPLEDGPRILASLCYKEPELLSVIANNPTFIQDFVAIYCSSALSSITGNQQKPIFAESNWSKLKKIKPYLAQFETEHCIEDIIRSGGFYYKSYEHDKIYNIQNIDPFYFLDHMGFKKIKESLIKNPIPVENLKPILRHIAALPKDFGDDPRFPTRKFRVFLNSLSFWSTAVNWKSLTDYSKEDDLKTYMGAAFSIFKNIPNSDIVITQHDILVPQLNELFSNFYQAQPETFLSYFKQLSQDWGTPSTVQHDLFTYMKSEVLNKTIKTVSPGLSVKGTLPQRF